MRIIKVLFFYYRNYKKLELDINSNLVIFTGKNGSGKSNCLEGIFLACIGKSFRTNYEKDLIQWNQAAYRVVIDVEREEGIFSIEITADRQGRKKISINGNEINKFSELMGTLNCVMFSPDDLRMIKNGPNERRRYIDIELSQIDKKYFFHLQRYHRILKQRNKLLKQLSYQKNTGFEETLSIWDASLADEAAQIIYRRKKFIEELSVSVRELHQKISNNREILSLQYQASIDYINSIEETRKNVLFQLSQKKEEDVIRGVTTKGCHRDDFLIEINGKDAKTFGSQGQQRTAILSMKLAEIKKIKEEVGEMPILLLDDVMSELDNERKSYLLKSIQFVQTFITTTEIKDIILNDFKSVAHFNVEQGKITRG